MTSLPATSAPCRTLESTHDARPTQGRLVIAAGMQRAGTRWFCNMLVDIVGEVTGNGTRQLRERYAVEDLLQRYHTPTFKARFSNRRLRRLDAIVADGHTLVFKTHRPPATTLCNRLAGGEAVATYIVRDPRKVVISALEQGAKMRSQGALPFRGFARLSSFDRTFRWLRREVLPIWQQWTSVEGVLTLRYEDLLEDPRGSMGKTINHIGIAARPEIIDRVVQNYTADNIQDGTVRRALDLDKAGTTQRQFEFTSEQEQRLETALQPVLLQMGYLPSEKCRTGS